MKLSAGLVAQKDKDEETAATVSRVHYYTCCVLSYAGGSSSGSLDGTTFKPSRPLFDYKYLKKSARKLTLLAVLQVLCGLAMIAIQIYPTYWFYYVASQQEVKPDLHWRTMDSSMPGIWCGAWILCSGIFGLVIRKKSSIALVGIYMGLNIGVIAFAICLIALSGFSSSGILACKIDGSWSRFGDSYLESFRSAYSKYRTEKSNYDNHYGPDRWRYHDYGDSKGSSTTTTTTTTPPPPTTPSIPPPVELLGEIFVVKPDYSFDQFRGDTNIRFYCKNAVFTYWLMAEALMMAVGVAAVITTICLIVMESKANCLCCRRCCDTEEKKNEGEDVLLITPTDYPESDDDAELKSS